MTRTISIRVRANRQLDYESLQSLKVRYQSLEGKQPLFYAANAVGLKYAIQALDEHLLSKPKPGKEKRVWCASVWMGTGCW